MDLTKVKVGDRLIRETTNPFGRPNKTWRTPALVIKVTPEEIVCMVSADVSRVMRFDAHTGMNTSGPDYGWLDEQSRHEKVAYKDSPHSNPAWFERDWNGEG